MKAHRCKLSLRVLNPLHVLTPPCVPGNTPCACSPAIYVRKLGAASACGRQTNATQYDPRSNIRAACMKASTAPCFANPHQSCPPGLRSHHGACGTKRATQSCFPALSAVLFPSTLCWPDGPSFTQSARTQYAAVMPDTPNTLSDTHAPAELAPINAVPTPVGMRGLACDACCTQC